MQVLQAGERKLLLLELEMPIVEGIATQLGYEVRNSEETPRVVSLELSTASRHSPLLLFDATDPGNLGWFSRCQFYVEGQTGAVLQTPMRLGNVRDPAGRTLPDCVRLQIDKELPARFRVPGKQPLNEQAIYAILYNLLNAMVDTGVAVCGRGVIKPLAGRTQRVRARN